MYIYKCNSIVTSGAPSISTSNIVVLSDEQSGLSSESDEGPVDLLYLFIVHFQLLLKSTLTCSFKFNINPPSSASSSAASGPQLDEQFCTLMVALTSAATDATQVQHQVEPPMLSCGSL